MRVLLDEAAAGVAARFVRAEPRATAAQSVDVPLSGLEPRPCWSLTERAGHTDPRAMRWLLRTVVWDADTVRAGVRDRLIEQLGHPDGVLVTDETRFPEIRVRPRRLA